MSQQMERKSSIIFTDNHYTCKNVLFGMVFKIFFEGANERALVDNEERFKQTSEHCVAST